MKSFELTDDEFETLREAFGDVGNDCPGVDWDKFEALGVKLGVLEPELPLTPEQLKIREEMSKLVREMLIKQNEYLVKEMIKSTAIPDVSLGIKLPNDYQVKK